MHACNFLNNLLAIDIVSDLRLVGDVSPGTPVSSINKTDRHHITEILLKEVFLLLDCLISLSSYQW